MTSKNYTRTSPHPHRAPRQARKIVAFYGNDFQWLVRLINAELRIQKKTRDRTPPNTTKYAAAVSSILQCEQVLARMKKGKISWDGT